MDNSEAVDKLKAYLKCQKRQVTGIYEHCYNKKCNNCDLCYMKGTTDEHLTSIELAIQALEKLKEYEQLEEQGRFMKLPCKVGDTIWHIEEDNKISKLIVDHIDINDNYIYYFVDDNINGLSFIVSDDEFSQTAFVTKSEAEAKLKELRGNND